MFMDSPYSILKIPKNASKEEITKAYRAIARQYHPDKNKEEGAKEIFAKAKDAYEYLMDDTKRSFFDRTGIRQNESSPPPNSPSPFPFRTGVPFPFHSGGIFPQMSQAGFLRRQLNISVTIELTLDQIYRGISRNIHYSRTRIHNNQQQNEDCTVPVTIPAGIHCPSQMEIPNQGHVLVGNDGVEIKGALILELYQAPHSLYTRDNRHPENLVCSREITLHEALCGLSIQLPLHPSGETITFMYFDVIRPPQLYRIPGRGLPLVDCPSTYGDLILRFSVVFPAEITHSQKNTLATLFQYNIPEIPEQLDNHTVSLLPYDEEHEPNHSSEPEMESVQCSQS